MFLFKQKTAYEMRISDWSSDVCSSDLLTGGAWDPTLAFVMGGAIIPMAVAWVVRGRLDAPVAAPEFTVPGTNPITPRLIGGAMLFGIGWGIAGLCPGPAIADLALRPLEAGVFVLAMLAGFALHRLVDRTADR